LDELSQLVKEKSGGSIEGVLKICKYENNNFTYVIVTYTYIIASTKLSL